MNTLKNDMTSITDKVLSKTFKNIFNNLAPVQMFEKINISIPNVKSNKKQNSIQQCTHTLTLYYRL